MELIVSDVHEGLQAARRAVFPSVSWPRAARFICSTMPDRRYER